MKRSIFWQTFTSVLKECTVSMTKERNKHAAGGKQSSAWLHLLPAFLFGLILALKMETVFFPET
jgi:hypothetical protein